MKNFIAMRLIIFIFPSMCMYFYMGNMLALQVPEKTKIQVDKIAIQDSYKIWEAIEGLEDSWRKRDANFKIILNAFSAKYPYLKTNIDDLIAAQEKKDWDGFLYYKEVIMKELRPIWNEQRSQIKDSWWQWFKNRTQNLLQRMYNYFSSSKVK